MPVKSGSASHEGQREPDSNAAVRATWGSASRTERQRDGIVSRGSAGRMGQHEPGGCGPGRTAGSSEQTRVKPLGCHRPQGSLTVYSCKKRLDEGTAAHGREGLRFLKLGRFSIRTRRSLVEEAWPGKRYHTRTSAILAPGGRPTDSRRAEESLTAAARAGDERETHNLEGRQRLGRMITKLGQRNLTWSQTADLLEGGRRCGMSGARLLTLRQGRAWVCAHQTMRGGCGCQHPLRHRPRRNRLLTMSAMDKAPRPVDTELCQRTRSGDFGKGTTCRSTTRQLGRLGKDEEQIAAEAGNREREREELENLQT